MTDDSPRRYTEQEFTKVLETALRLQGERAPRRLGGDGLTLEEMVAAAVDVGIDPGLVEQAVGMLPHRGGTGERILGGPTRYQLSRTVPGEATPNDLSRILDLIREELGTPGRSAPELGGLTWETEGEPSQFHVTLRPEDDRTHVRVAVNRDAAFILSWFMPLMTGLIAAGITGASLDPAVPEGLLIIGAGATGGLAVARTLWSRSTRIVRDKANHLIDRIARGLQT